MPGRETNHYLYLPLFLLIAYFPLFHHLDANSFRMWDEAIYAVNAFEMAQNNDFICRHFEGEPILWNPKPPLVTWIQTASFKLFGYSELSFRLPVALFCLITVLGILWFFVKNLNFPLLGYLSGFVLLTTSGYINYHVARTGDPDGVLVFFVFAYCLVFFRWIEDPLNKPLYSLFIFLLLCAIFTKSFAGMVATPALFLWAIYRRKLKQILIQPFLYIGIGAILIPVSGYYLLHEVLTPGFIDSVLNKESGRYLSVIQHGEGFWFYFCELYHDTFLPWILLIPISLFLIAYEKSIPLKRFLQFLSLLSIVYIIVLSISETKLIWYIAPVYPFLSILAAYALYKIFLLISGLGDKYLRLAASIIVVGLMFIPYFMIVEKITTQKDKPGEKYAKFIKLVGEEKGIKEFSLVTNELNPHATYYRQYYNYQGDFKIDKKFPLQIVVEDTVLSCDYRSLEDIRELYKVKNLYRWRNCELVWVVDTIKQL